MGDGERSERPRWRRALGWLSQFGVALAIYFVFAAKVDGHEALIGAVASAIAATGSRVVLRERAARFSGRWWWIVQAYRLPKYVVTGTWQVFTVLFRHLFTRSKAGSFLLEVPFDTGGDDDASATRRALAIAYTTITPNFIVLGFDRERRRMIYYQIAVSPIPEMLERLGAAP